MRLISERVRGTMVPPRTHPSTKVEHPKLLTLHHHTIPSRKRDQEVVVVVAAAD